jgi:hypothetical protein
MPLKSMVVRSTSRPALLALSIPVHGPIGNRQNYSNMVESETQAMRDSICSWADELPDVRLFYLFFLKKNTRPLPFITEEKIITA